MKNDETNHFNQDRIIEEAPLRVLYVHHAGPFGGSSRSLLELIQAFPVGAVRPFVVTQRGQYESILKENNIEVLSCAGISQFDNTLFGRYRGARWLILLREISYLPATVVALFRARYRWSDFDLIHINDITLISVIWLAKKLFACPIVCHVRSVQGSMEGIRGKLLSNILKSNVDRFIIIDETVQRSMNSELIGSVIHNGLALTKGSTDKESRKDEVFTIGMIGGFSRSKGCLEFIEAARLCKDQGKRFRFVFIGQSMRKKALIRDALLHWFGLSQEIEKEMTEMINLFSLQDTVEIWPFTIDLDKVYTKLDAVCFPSHFNAPGRPIFEAALYSIPSIAAISQPTNDTIIDSVTGIVVPPGNVDLLAQAIIFLGQNREKRIKMGQNARILAHQNFDINKNALSVLNLYRDLVDLK